MWRLTKKGGEIMLELTHVITCGEGVHEDTIRAYAQDGFSYLATFPITADRNITIFKKGIPAPEEIC